MYLLTINIPKKSYKTKNKKREKYHNYNYKKQRSNIKTYLNLANCEYTNQQNIDTPVGSFAQIEDREEDIQSTPALILQYKPTSSQHGLFDRDLLHSQYCVRLHKLP